MKKKIVVVSFLLIVVILMTYVVVRINTLKYDTKSGDRFNSIPTLYLHGWGAGARSSNSLISYAEKHNNAKKVLVAKVLKSGQVIFSGSWPNNVKRPIIQIVMADNKNSDYQLTEKWYANILKKLKDDYHIKKYNTVSHSMGNLTTMYFQMSHKSSELPSLNRQVNIAGHFDGILGIDDTPNKNSLVPNGEPKIKNHYYSFLNQHRNEYPDGSVKVLNIFGNLNNGTNSDGSVSVVSAKSLKWLLRGKYKSYQEYEVFGDQGQHSKLHENDRVSQVIGNFLWP